MRLIFLEARINFQSKRCCIYKQIFVERPPRTLQVEVCFVRQFTEQMFYCFRSQVYYYITFVLGRDLSYWHTCPHLDKMLKRDGNLKIKANGDKRNHWMRAIVPICVSYFSHEWRGKNLCVPICTINIRILIVFFRWNN